MTSTIYTIYKITNIVNGKIYIGAHKQLEDEPLYEYMGSGVGVISDIKKCGKNKFFKKILHTFDNEYDMYNMEEYIVDKAFVARKDTYNRIKGGNIVKSGEDHPAFGNHTKRSNETKQRLSKSKIGSKNPMFGHRYTDEEKAAMSIKVLDRGAPWKGKKLSEEHIKKLSESHKGKMIGTEHPSFTNYWDTPIGKFTSISTAAKTIGSKQATIRKWCLYDIIITNHMYGRSKFLQSIGSRNIIVGTTSTELGFNILY